MKNGRLKKAYFWAGKSTTATKREVFLESSLDDVVLIIYSIHESS